MRCERAREALTTRDGGGLSPWWTRRLERHLSGCAGCRAEAIRDARLTALFATLPAAAPVSPRLAADTFRAVRLLAAEEEEQRAAWSGRRWLEVLLPVLSATAVLLVALRAPMSNPGPAGAPSDDGAASDAAARVAARWDDGAGTPPAAIPPTVEVAAAGRPTLPPAPSGDAVPDALLRAPELYTELDVVRHLEKLQHFEELRTDLDPGATRSDG